MHVVPFCNLRCIAWFIVVSHRPCAILRLQTSMEKPISKSDRYLEISLVLIILYLNISFIAWHVYKDMQNNNYFMQFCIKNCLLNQQSDLLEFIPRDSAESSDYWFQTMYGITSINLDLMWYKYDPDALEIIYKILSVFILLFAFSFMFFILHQHFTNVLLILHTSTLRIKRIHNTCLTFKA